MASDRLEFILGKCSAPSLSRSQLRMNTPKSSNSSGGTLASDSPVGPHKLASGRSTSGSHDIRVPGRLPRYACPKHTSGTGVPQTPAARPATLARPRRAEYCPNSAIHQCVQRASSQPGHLAGYDPLSVEYANLHCMYPAAIHLQQFHFEKIHIFQSLTDANGQIAVHSPTPAQAAINLCTETNIAVHNLHHRLLFSRSRISIRFHERNVTIHAHIEPIARSNLHRGLDIQILARYLHTQLAELLAKSLSCCRARRQRA